MDDLKYVRCKTCRKEYPTHDMYESGDCKWCEPRKKLEAWLAWRDKRAADKGTK